MINVKELMVGNWIQWSSAKFPGVNTFEKVDENDFGRIAWSNWRDEYSPIPLTPEILEKAGFRQMVIDGKKKWKREPNDSFYLYGHDNTGFYSPYVMPEVQSLHQLQNLYFALTGEELPIEL